MGCPLSRNEVKGHDLPHHRHREQLHFVDEYGQPITVQVEEQRGRGHGKRPARYAAVDSSVEMDRQWDNLSAMALMKREEARRESYSAGPYYGHMAMSPDMYPANNHMMMSPDLYPSNGYLSNMSPDQSPSNSYLPTVSYSLDHLDRLECQALHGSPYQPNSESCLLIGCCNAEKAGPNCFPRQSDSTPLWRPGGAPSYLPLSELDSGLGCGPDSPHHQMALSEAETDAVSSLPGHTPSSPGSSPSSESLLSSEPSDSGFHSVSTGEFRRFHKMHGSHAHRHVASHRAGHSPLEQRGRWDLESIPESAQISQANGGQPSQCTVGNSVNTTVQFHRAEKSPPLPRHHPSSWPLQGCHTEPCQRRVLWLEQQHYRGGRTIDTPGRSQTLMDLSDGQRPRRASHPNMSQAKPARCSQSAAASGALEPRSRASYPNQDRLGLTSSYTGQPLLPLPGERSAEEWEVRWSPGSASSQTSDCRGFQTLGNRPGHPRYGFGPLYSTLAGAPRPSRSPPSPRYRMSNQKAVRNQLLRARASRLARERSEVTTDEETHGGGGGGGGDAGGPGEGEEGHWAGRYWSRAERRRHLALSRQHRERRAGGGGAGEEAVGGARGASSRTVLELSHRKQNRLRNSKLLDDWTTVEELLTHGTRVETDSQLCPSPLLSVTTV